MDTPSREVTLSKLILSPEKGSTLKKKMNLLSWGANFFPLDPVSEGTDVQESNQEVTKVAIY